MIDHTQLHRDGYALLRRAIPAPWLAELRATFDFCVLPSADWPVPRGSGWRHSMLDLDPKVQTVCRLCEVQQIVGTLVGERYFLAQVEGREPLAGGGQQGLHRDQSSQRPGDTIQALAYLDDFGPHNGATRLVPASHRPTATGAPSAVNSEGRAQQIFGSAGDVLVFDADLLHAATLNPSGARRRSLLISYRAEPLYASHLTTAQLRAVRMDTSDRFDPPQS